MSRSKTWNETEALQLVRDCVAKELPPTTPMPGDEEDLAQEELVDSMGWVGILSGIEERTGIRNFGNPWPPGRPQSIHALAEILREAKVTAAVPSPDRSSNVGAETSCEVSIQGWGYALGSVTLSGEEVEQEIGLDPGTLVRGAGIESVRRAAEDETEVTLAVRAAGAAAESASLVLDEVDVLVSTSTTFLQLPGLAATLHSRLLLRENAAALDVGGACVGLIHALSVARGLLQSGQRALALVVASEVHSRRLASPGVPAEMRGLFGDGACAFLLRREEEGAEGGAFRVGDFVGGCAGTFASAVRASLQDNLGIVVQFQGEQIGQAAVTHLDRVFTSLERLTGKSRNEADCFALHEPNPRLVEILAQKAGIAPAKIPQISRTCGNLGAATCGVSLCQALTDLSKRSARAPLIFLAAVAPGLLWAGTVIR